jgi:hypothetical protein
MRRWLLILMVALLPLRGWVGDVMAMEMASGAVANAESTGLNAINYIAEYQAKTRTKALFDSEVASQPHTDCPGHADAAAAGPADAADADASHTDCTTCTSCQVCHAVGLVAVVDAPASHRPQLGAPSASDAQFASAPPARGFKPPIS